MSWVECHLQDAVNRSAGPSYTALCAVGCNLPAGSLKLDALHCIVGIVVVSVALSWVSYPRNVIWTGMPFTRRARVNKAPNGPCVPAPLCGGEIPAGSGMQLCSTAVPSRNTHSAAYVFRYNRIRNAGKPRTAGQCSRSCEAAAHIAVQWSPMACRPCSRQHVHPSVLLYLMDTCAGC